LESLDLSPPAERIFDSAQKWFEKPHSKAFGTVLTAIEDAAEGWMIGDSVSSDIAGAQAVGLP
jgi:FMN phosphatase YigB (HAD superfamily)